jgi:hypothetical protein
MCTVGTNTSPPSNLAYSTISFSFFPFFPFHSPSLQCISLMEYPRVDKDTMAVGSTLHRAAASGSLTELKAILLTATSTAKQVDAELNFTGDSSKDEVEAWTALHFATALAAQEAEPVRSTGIAMMRGLLDAGANPNLEAHSR